MKKKIIIISSIFGVLCLIGIGSYIVINQVNEKIVMVSNIVDEPVSEDIEEESTEIETVTVEQESVVETESVEESSVVETTEVESTESDVSNEYYTKDDNGNISVSEDFYSSLQAYSFFEGATVTEVNEYLTGDGTFLLDFIEYEDTEGFDMFAGALGENGDKLHEEGVVTTKPAEKPAQQTQQPVQQEPVQQPAQPSQQEQIFVQEPAPTLTPEEAARIAALDELERQAEAEEAARRANNTDRWGELPENFMDNFTAY